ncbi:MAG: penicillin-binding protein 2 [Proteobacteria bacterium]|nr:penicillin-binding protein 2 [Pseudomonadota bacterium]
MAQFHRQIKNPQYETKIFASRITIASICVLMIIAILFARYFYLQIIQHEELLAKSERNRIKITALAPARGFIYDRNHKLLVDNLPTYRLQMVPEKVSGIAQKLQEIQILVNLSNDKIAEIVQAVKHNKIFTPILIKAKLTEKELATFIARKHYFTGFTATPYLIRHYKYTDILAHVVGYVGRINAQDQQNLDTKRYLGTDYTGKLGIEKYHEKTLHGYPGSLVVETNAQGRVLKTLEQNQPISGKDIILTIDIDLQKAAYEALGELTGSIIAINPNNGEILAMVSKPGFNPNDFVNGMSHKLYSSLVNSDKKPLFNRSIKGGYEPGSTIKPYMALAGLYYKIIDLNYSMFSKGYFQLPKQKRRYHDWKRGGHGKVDIEQSLAQSVNTFYYGLSVKLGIDRIHEFLNIFKVGQKSNIGLLGEKQGLLPSRAWKKAVKNTVWYHGETVITGIGQGFLVSTPIQLATSLSILANRGKFVQPHLIKSNHQPPIPISLQIPTEYWDSVHAGMVASIHSKTGTARAIKPEGYLIAGKSGSSQVYGKKEKDVYNKKLEIPLHLRNHALFIAFAPADNPQIAVIVVAEHGVSGSKTAAPIAGTVIAKFMHDIYPDYNAIQR